VSRAGLKLPKAILHGVPSFGEVVFHAFCSRVYCIGSDYAHIGLPKFIVTVGPDVPLMALVVKMETRLRFVMALFEPAN
jgi:hypothetical protein